jgi:undecaprenyl phosphate N,N'-diacetylbacillosamine 1-phosphate transferase
MQIEHKSSLNLTNCQGGQLSNKNGIYRRHIKRPMDFILSLCAIIVLSPVLLIIAILVRIKLGSPVLFKQKRPGLNEKIFTLYKFRTMTDERDKNGDFLPDSVRLTKFGRLLRNTSLDELPELFNILKGDMSIVGPRPLLIKYLPYFSEEEKLRFIVRPGLSGLAQINGRNNIGWDSRLALDVKYVDNISFILDLKIIMISVLKAIKQEDITITDTATLKDLDVERRVSFDN